MNKQELIFLTNRILKGQASVEEIARYNEWFNVAQNVEPKLIENAETKRIVLLSRIQQAIHPQKNNIHQLVYRITAAAAILFFISVGGYFFLHKEQHVRRSNQTNDITPGINGATLTLANGKIIILSSKSNGQLVVQGNMSVTKSAGSQLQYQMINNNTKEVAINTLATKRKEQYKMVLSDGTNVWLNAASSITYPVAFNGKDRSVSITGEVYFEVAHNAKKTFKVTTGKQVIEVLGTHFDVNAYADEPNTRTTLLKGSVRMITTSGITLLKPGEQAILTKTKLFKQVVDIEDVMAWKEGMFRFTDESLESVMRKISRWYNVDISYDSDNIKQLPCTGITTRFANVSTVLKMIELTKHVHFNIKPGEIMVVGGEAMPGSNK